MKHILPLVSLCLTGPALADPPLVEGATYANGALSVTLSHPDTGWEHYADAWEVLDTDGQSLGVRELAHPHVNEQPFTRSLRVELPGQAPWTVQIRARDNTTGWSDPVTLTLD